MSGQFTTFAAPIVTKFRFIPGAVKFRLTPAAIRLRPTNEVYSLNTGADALAYAADVACPVRLTI